MKQVAGLGDENADQRYSGVGEWEAVWLGRADYLPNGLERDWSYRDVVVVNGEVISVRLIHSPSSSTHLSPRANHRLKTYHLVREHRS